MRYMTPADIAQQPQSETLDLTDDEANVLMHVFASLHPEDVTRIRENLTPAQDVILLAFIETFTERYARIQEASSGTV